MKDVDSLALERVAKALRLGGRTSGQTDFDDEHLQQALDVRSLIPGEGVEDGWVWLQVGDDTVTSADHFSSIADVRDAVFDVLQPDPQARDSLDVWLMDVAGEWIAQDAADDVQVQVQARFPVFPSNPTGVYRPLVFAGNARGDDPRAVSGGAIPIKQSDSSAEGVPRSLVPRVPPLRMPRGSSLVMCARVFIAGAPTQTVNYFFLFWAGPRGLRPPGIA